MCKAFVERLKPYLLKVESKFLKVETLSTVWGFSELPPHTVPADSKRTQFFVDNGRCRRP
jgi:hypothetical protein